MSFGEEKTRVNLRVVLHIDNQLSWGELIAFAEAARRSGVNPGQLVMLEGVTGGDDIQMSFAADEADIAPAPGTLISVQ